MHGKRKQVLKDFLFGMGFFLPFLIKNNFFVQFFNAQRAYVCSIHIISGPDRSLRS